MKKLLLLVFLGAIGVGIYLALQKLGDRASI
jgi:hypothetical protein